MKLRQSIVVFLSAFAIGVLLFTITAELNAQDAPQTKAQHKTPLIALASVRVGGCSGTVVYVDSAKRPCAYIVSANHCCGRVGSQIGIEFVNEREANARVIALDAGSDLALLKTWADDVVAVCPVAKTFPPANATWTACGYPGGRGPKYKLLGKPAGATINGRMERNEYRLRKGPFFGGDSGGSVAANDELVGVISHGHDNDTIYASQHVQLVKFLRANTMQCRECKDAWWNQPNLPIRIPGNPNVEANTTFGDRLDRIESVISRLVQQAQEAAEEADRSKTKPKPDEADLEQPLSEILKNKHSQILQMVVDTERKRHQVQLMQMEMELLRATNNRLKDSYKDLIESVDPRKPGRRFKRKHAGDPGGGL